MVKRQRSPSPEDDTPARTVPSPPTNFTKNFDIQDDVVLKLLVGQDYNVFYVHKRLLDQASITLIESLRELYSTSSDCSAEIRLPCYEPHHFKRFTQWLYTGKSSSICPYDGRAYGPWRSSCWEAGKAYQFARIFEIEGFRLYMCTQFYEFLNRLKNPSTPNFWSVLHHNLSAKALKHMVLDRYKQVIDDDWLVEHGKELLAKQDFAIDLMRAMRKTNDTRAALAFAPGKKDEYLKAFMDEEDQEAAL